MRCMTSSALIYTAQNLIKSAKKRSNRSLIHYLFITYLCSKQHNVYLRYDIVVRNAEVCIHHVYNVHNYIDAKI